MFPEKLFIFVIASKQKTPIPDDARQLLASRLTDNEVAIRVNNSTGLTVQAAELTKDELAALAGAEFTVTSYDEMMLENMQRVRNVFTVERAVSGADFDFKDLVHLNKTFCDVQATFKGDTKSSATIEVAIDKDALESALGADYKATLVKSYRLLDIVAEHAEAEVAGNNPTTQAAPEKHLYTICRPNGDEIAPTEQTRLTQIFSAHNIAPFEESTRAYAVESALSRDDISNLIGGSYMVTGYQTLKHC
ncbi:MAG: hypothetical protein GC136_02445 [Alphaproteobacteria bacterium]|nr:hypothetical protein [Alphaproteobacteria bacterium]